MGAGGDDTITKNVLKEISHWLKILGWRVACTRGG